MGRIEKAEFDQQIQGETYLIVVIVQGRKDENLIEATLHNLIAQPQNHNLISLQCCHVHTICCYLASQSRCSNSLTIIPYASLWRESKLGLRVGQRPF